jgi:putative transposase
MQQFEKLEYGQYYHIYSHGVGKRDLFKDAKNYEQFLSLYDKYIEPIAGTYAWVLMPNHFHVLVWIKENVVYKYSNNDRSIDPDRFKEVKWQTVELTPNPTASEGPVGVEDSIEDRKKPKPHLHFSHMLNAYSRYFNTYHETRGTLFERPFQRKLVDTKEYLKQLVLYIHNNPVHHGFCSHPIEYPWSSYQTCISIKPTKLHRNAVLGWFDGEANFIIKHGEALDIKEIDGWLMA